MTGKEVSIHPVRRRSGDTRDLAARLAPLEEMGESSEADRPSDSPVVAQENGAIVVGAQHSELAKEAIAEEQNRPSGLEPVVIVIVGLLLAFIVFIAWQISQMPER